MITNTQPRLRTKLSALYRRCRCFSCTAHPDHAVLLRRPTTVPSRLSYSNVATTLFYSTVIATGALFDSDLKRRRRTALDDAIEQAQRNIATEQQRQASRLASLGVAIAEAPRESVQEADVAYNQEKTPSIRTDGKSTNLKVDRYGFGRMALNHLTKHTALDHKLDQDVGSSGSTSVGRNGLTELSRLAQQPSDSLDIRTQRQVDLALYAVVNPDFEITHHYSASSPYSVYANADARATRSRHSPKRLAMKEYAVAILATKMKLALPRLRAASRESLSSQLSELLRGYLEANRERDPERLERTTKLTIPSYSPDADDAAQLEKDLRLAITAVIENYMSGYYTKETMYRKLSYNLLHSPIPPHRDHFCNMIRLLAKARELPMAKHVIDCFLASKERHDEVSIVTILTAYRQMGDDLRFSNFCAMVLGSHTDAFGNQQALMLAHTPKSYVQTPLPWLEPHGDQEQTRVRVAFSPMIWSAVICGCIKFGQLDHAYDLMKRMKEEGFTPGMEILYEIMLRSIDKSDYKAALATWDIVAKRHLQHAPTKRLAHGSIEHRCIHLALIASNDGGRPAAYGQIYRSALRHGLQPRALLPRKLPSHLGRPTGFQASLQRRVRLLQETCEILARDLLRFRLSVFASCMAIRGCKYEEIKLALHEMATRQKALDVAAGQAERSASVTTGASLPREGTRPKAGQAKSKLRKQRRPPSGRRLRKRPSQRKPRKRERPLVRRVTVALRKDPPAERGNTERRDERTNQEKTRPLRIRRQTVDDSSGALPSSHQIRPLIRRRTVPPRALFRKQASTEQQHSGPQRTRQEAENSGEVLPITPRTAPLIRRQCVPPRALFRKRPWTKQTQSRPLVRRDPVKSRTLAREEPETMGEHRKPLFRRKYVQSTGAELDHGAGASSKPLVRRITPGTS